MSTLTGPLAPLRTSVPFRIPCPKEPAEQLQPLRLAVVSALTEWLVAFAVAAALIASTVALA